MMSEITQQHRLPTLYIPHGGGPCFFMDWTMGPADTWDGMAAWLRTLGEQFQHATAILVISAHWEEPVVTVQSGAEPPLLFDYYGFPAHTYELVWAAPGAPVLAARVQALLGDAGFPTRLDADRGFDHGVFVPLKVAFPEPSIPTAQLSLKSGLDPEAHLAMGRALAPLRDEGVLIVGSGLSFHNMQAMSSGAGSRLEASQAFDRFLGDVCADERKGRERGLAQWSNGPHARDCHPREEHLLPLMVVAGAAGDDRGSRVFSDRVLGVEVSAFQFGEA